MQHAEVYENSLCVAWRTRTLDRRPSSNCQAGHADCAHPPRRDPCRQTRTWEPIASQARLHPRMVTAAEPGRARLSHKSRDSSASPGLRVLVLPAALLLFGGGASGCGGCDGGGPGCGEQYLIACEALGVGERYSLAGAYSDDSATYVWPIAEASISGDGVASLWLDDGRAAITIGRAGRFALDARLEGWSSPHRWWFDAVEGARCIIPDDLSDNSAFHDDSMIRPPD